MGVVLWKIRQVMAEFPRDYQILVADDASTDKTSEVLSPYARVLPLTVVRTETRRGYAASLEMLLREAVRRSEYPKRDVIVTIQADFSQEPEDIVPIIKAMEAGADIVCGEATLPAETAWKIRWSRGMAARLLGRKSVPQGVKDPFTGFRAYRVFTVKKAIEERAGSRLLLHDSWAANAELLALTAAHARRVDPLDVTVRPHRLQRPSRLHPWPALKNVWKYARKAKPEIEQASVEELDDAVAAVSTSRRNDAASVRERMSERSDMHGNRSPHGDRQPHNARTERPRHDRGRDRNGQPRAPQGRPQPAPAAGRNDAQRARSADQRPPRDRNKPDRPQTPRTPNETPQNERAQQTAQPQGERKQNPRRERKPRNARRENGDAQALELDLNAIPLAEAAAPVEGATANGSNGEPDSAAVTGEPTKRRRRRGRRSRGGAKRNNNGAEGDVSADTISEDINAESPAHESDFAETSGSESSDADAAPGGDEAPGSDGAPAKKRRRGRRGGRGRRRQGASNASADGAANDADVEHPEPQVTREVQPQVQMFSPEGGNDAA